ncbi:SDR family NAD(P)-dependent oxidoreductase [Serinicoccus kebangsaanensis]|uniref:SDR family NAD(P)-dependent oxidoreductase n=1 Tax=Serinicoccus kebangsaanensis TaxID=2602069 RepID=UPI00124E6606|nr:SDR family oxidoreductase [Serinicoccus kebangsaanensis]
MPQRDLTDQRVAVVGATGALGSRVARGLAAGGARLLLVGRDEQRLQQVAQDLGAGATVVGDLGDATTGDRVAETAREQLGGLDGLVNAAGIAAFGPLVDTPDAVVEEVFTTNVVGPAFLLRRLLPLLQETEGFVVNLSAILAERPMAGMGAYSASKAALTALDRSLAGELRRAKVRVLDVRPPHTETGLVDRAIHGEAPRLPDGLSPDDVADRVVRAITEDASDLGSDDFLEG